MKYKCSFCDYESEDYSAIHRLSWAHLWAMVVWYFKPLIWLYRSLREIAR